jgi:hypothetical protein
MVKNEAIISDARHRAKSLQLLVERYRGAKLDATSANNTADTLEQAADALEAAEKRVGEQDREAHRMARLCAERNKSVGGLFAEIERLRELVRHAWIHSGYLDCGYRAMTTEQKNLYCETIGNDKEEHDAALARGTEGE